MLEKEFQYYLDHIDELNAKYEGKVIVIVGESVVGVYESEAEAYSESVKKHELGTFLIQHVYPGAEKSKQIFHSKVIFR